MKFLLLLLAVHAIAAPPNIVFLVADDMRPDAIAALGHPVVQTPNLDSLVREGATFTRAITGYPICHVSRAEFLTGRCAFQTGVQYRGKALDPTAALWPDTFRRAGYRTWFAGKWHNDGQPKQRGFETTGGLYSSGGAKGRTQLPDYAGRPATGYTGWTFKTDDGAVETDKGVGLTPDTDRFIADGAIDLIRRKPADPFFLQVSFTGPHDPLIWPRGYESRHAAAKMPLPKNFAPEHPYDHGNAGSRDEVIVPPPRTAEQVRAELAVYFAIIENLDEQVGRIVAALRETGAWENTIFIFTSDHGLALGSHGLTGKQNQYEHTIGVPLILRGPGIPRDRRIAAQCYLRDLFPTTCEMAGIAIPASVQSKSLVPSFTGATIHPEVFACFTDTQRMVRDDRWKLVWYPKLSRYQLFDLAADPDELRDLAAAQPERVATMKTTLESWLKANGDPLFDR
ncbi:MAG: sulfatase-like hydrolase/transferase [Chthoniobacteraceae bacterium]